MQRRTRYLLGGFALCFVLAVGAMGFAFVRLLKQGAAPSIEAGSILEITLAGSVVDSPPDSGLPLEMLDQGGTPLASLQLTLRKAKADARIRGVLLNLQSPGMGWSVAQELRTALKEFQASGKPITAYMESGQDKDYYVASVANKVYMAPQGFLMLNGLVLEAQFFKDALAKVGVEADMHHIGEYKSAAETFSRNSMSEANREVLNSMADGLYRLLVEGIAEGRRLKPEEVTAFIDDFSFSPSKAVETKLLDGLLFYDQVLDSLKQPGEEEPKLVDGHDYAKVPANSLGLETGPKVAVLYVTGEISSGESGGGGLFGSQSVGSETIVEAIEDIREDDDIKAVVLRVDSPGGSALAADVMWRELVRLKAKKPLVVSMSTLAASGGYWISTAADTIVAEPGTITGSIGVIMGKFDVGGLFDKVGMKVEVISRGKYAQIFSALDRFSPDEARRVDEGLRETYDTFVGKVAKARKLTPAQVDAVARGRVWLGEQAKEKKLVDELGGLPQALALVRKQAKLDEKADLSLIHFPREGSFVERILKKLGMETQSQLPPELLRAMGWLNARERVDHAGPQALMPFIPVIY